MPSGSDHSPNQVYAYLAEPRRGALPMATMNFVQQILSLFNVKVSTAAGLVLMAACVILGDSASVFSLTDIGPWARPAAWVFLISAVVLLAVRSFQEVASRRGQQELSGLTFTQVQARLILQTHFQGAVQSYNLNVQCSCATENGNARIMELRLVSPSVSASHLEITGKDKWTEEVHTEPHIKGGEHWSLGIAGFVTPRQPLAFGQIVKVEVDLIDHHKRAHRVSAKAQVV